MLPTSRAAAILAPMKMGDFDGNQARTSDLRRDVCFITISYRGDFELARDLCASIDHFADPEIEHVLVVPRSDLSLFSPLVNGSRRLIAVESVLPKGYIKLPLPRHIALGPYRRSIREIWWGPTGLVRGWIVQQILKLSAPAITRRDVDRICRQRYCSRPPSVGQFVHGWDRGSAVPGSRRYENSAMHQKWHTMSARLLGLEPKPYFGADYIGNLISWRRDVILHLQAWLTSLTGKRWDKIIARQTAFSEYILYGIFAEHVLGLIDCEHFPTSQDLVHAGWHYPLNTSAGLDEFVEGFEPHHVGVAIQSTESFTIEERRLLIRRTVSSG